MSEQTSALNSGNHRASRPYAMMHEGREIYSEWFNQLLSEYYRRYSDNSLSVCDIPSLIQAVERIENRLDNISTNGVQQSTLENHLGFITTYTSVEAFARNSGPTPGVVNGEAVAKHNRDSIHFFLHLPVAIALESWRYDPQLYSHADPVLTVHEALKNPTFIDCMEDFATTGFDILGDDFVAGLSKDEGDYGRGARRMGLGASEDDQEIVLVDTTTGDFTYRLAPWAKATLLSRLHAQNKNWPRHLSANPSVVGKMLKLPGPISAGCPVRNVSIKPLCEFLAGEIKPAYFF